MSAELKLTFVHSPQVYYEQNYGARFAPVWAYTLASYIDSKWKISIYDITVELLEQIPDSPIFAFSGINQDLPSIKKTFEYLKTKYPNSLFILGGPITWSFEKNGNLEELAFFDHLFILDGEKSLPQFLSDFEQKKPLPKVIRSDRYPLPKAKKLSFDLFKEKAPLYYGGVLEVARGCPFLCEFCDIRVLPQNNETHSKDVKLIIEELEHYNKLGIKQIQLACDNFIGDLQWANECVDAILEWTEKTKAKVALHTWCTVNLASHPLLMTKMRKAGFTSLFIGVESFNSNSILETSKVQNKNSESQLTKALRVIHSYGFIIAPGLIFGFDSDTPQMFEDTLTGVKDSGLIGGDPTFLIALPGTPLYNRMKISGRLVEQELEKERVSKVESNISYLQPQDFLIYGFLNFIKKFTSPKYAFERFKNHVDIIIKNGNLVSIHAIGYGNLKQYLKFQTSSGINFARFIARILLILKPTNLITVVNAYKLVFKNRRRYPGLKNHFMFWLFTWTNLILKYRNLKPSEFKLHSVEDKFSLEKIWEYKNYSDPNLVGGRNQENVKVGHQYKATQEALKVLENSYRSGKYSREKFKEAAEKFKKKNKSISLKRAA